MATDPQAYLDAATGLPSARTQVLASRDSRSRMLPPSGPCTLLRGVYVVVPELARIFVHLIALAMNNSADSTWSYASLSFCAMSNLLCF